MRGADASAGTIKSGGKCFKEGTLVATPSGLHPIEQLRIGDLVFDARRTAGDCGFHAQRTQAVFTRALTCEGYEVEVTEGHKFAYWNAVDGCFEVKPIEAFSPGESLYAPTRAQPGRCKDSSLPPEIADPVDATTTVEMQFPTELDDRLGYVLGLSYGDAELRTSYPYRLRVAFCKTSRARFLPDDSGTTASSCSASAPSC